MKLLLNLNLHSFSVSCRCNLRFFVIQMGSVEARAALHHEFREHRVLPLLGSAFGESKHCKYLYIHQQFAACTVPNCLSASFNKALASLTLRFGRYEGQPLIVYNCATSKTLLNR